MGLDNVDVEAATKAGVMVVNAPTSNIVSAAEHAVALLLALARNVPQAMASLQGRAVEARRVHRRGAARQGGRHPRAGQDRRAGGRAAGRVRHDGDRLRPVRGRGQGRRSWACAWSACDELLAEADFISVHLPRTAETIGLLGDRELRLVKPEVRIVNAARGGIVDEAALASAISERPGRRGRHWTSTPPSRRADSPLLRMDNVVVTPHLGASTAEAQEKAGIDVARSVRLALAGEFVPDAVNVQGGAVAEEIRPGLPLAEQLGRIFAALAGGVAARVEVEVQGEIAALDVSVLQLAAMKGIFLDSVAEPVTYVNAPLVANERGVEVSLVTDPRVPGLAEPDPAARHAARRPGRLGQRHAHRPAPVAQDRRDQRLRHGAGPGRAT